MNKVLGIIAMLFVSGMLLCIGGKAQQGSIPVLPVKMASLVKAFQEHEGIVVVNFWSTWCKPCIEEIPGFLQVLQDGTSQPVQLWLVSQDTRDVYEQGKLQLFIRARNWGGRHFWLDETNADYYCPLIDKSWSGVLPATLIVNRKNGFVHFTEGAMTPAQLRTLLAAAAQ